MDALASEFGEALTRIAETRVIEALHAWPAFSADALAFTRDLLVRATAVAGAEKTLMSLHVPDLYLAFACAGGCPIAHAAFEERFLSSIAPQIRSIDPSPSFADEVKQALRSRLLLASEDGPPKIATYSGQGPLGGWLRVAAIRTARNAKRGIRKTTEANDEVLAGRIAGDADPELAYLKANSADLFRSSFEGTLKALSARESSLLRLTYVERMTSDDIGRMYGVSGAAVRLWLKKIREDIVLRVRAALGSQVAADSRELRELVGLVESRFDLTLSRVLAESSH